MLSYRVILSAISTSKRKVTCRPQPYIFIIIYIYLYTAVCNIMATFKTYTKNYVLLFS